MKLGGPKTSKHPQIQNIQSPKKTKLSFYGNYFLCDKKYFPALDTATIIRIVDFGATDGAFLSPRPKGLCEPHVQCLYNYRLHVITCTCTQAHASARPRTEYDAYGNHQSAAVGRAGPVEERVCTFSHVGNMFSRVSESAVSEPR